MSESMAKVRVVNTSMIQPAETTPSSPIWLSNLDLFSSPGHVRVVYFFRRNSIDPSAAAAVKSSLARILVPYYPFAGRFGLSDTNGRREIKCSGEGVLFLEAVSDLTLDQFGVYTPSAENCRLLVPTDGLNMVLKHEDSIPILMAQITVFKCGGICLGIATHHHVADGMSALRFTCDWALFCRDPAIISLDSPPSFDRTSLRARNPPSVLFRHPEFELRDRPNQKNPTSYNYLKLTAMQINALKASCGGGHTMYETVTAHIWRCTCLARGPAKSDDEIRLVMAADVRSRLLPPLPSNFFGNAIVAFVAIAPATEVAAKLPTNRIREAIGKLDDEYLRSAIDFLEMQEEISGLARAAGNFAGTDIAVTSWTKLPVHDVDFGWGSPEFIGRASFFFPRQFVIQINLDGGVDVGCSLETKHMASFVQLFNALIPNS